MDLSTYLYRIDWNKVSPVLQNRTFQVHSIIQLNTEVSVKTKGNNNFNSFQPHIMHLLFQTQQTSLRFVFLRDFSHMQKCVVMLLCRDASSHSIWWRQLKRERGEASCPAFFNRCGEKAEQSPAASAKDATSSGHEFSTYISNSGKVICPLVFPGQDNCLI